MSRSRKMAKEISNYLREKLSSSEPSKQRVTFRRESQLHEPTKRGKAKKNRRDAKEDIRKENW